MATEETNNQLLKLEKNLGKDDYDILIQLLKKANKCLKEID